MKEKLRDLLAHLQVKLIDRDPAESINLTKRALAWEQVPRLPVVFSYPPPDEETFPLYPHQEVFEDPEKMLYNELIHAFGTSIACKDRLGDDLPCTIRANFGCVVIASMFGGRVEQVEDNPPWIRNEEGFDIYRSFRDHDPADFAQGWCPRVIERYRFYRDALSEYPPLDKLIHRVLPDLQGPIDTAELLRDSEIFVDMYERPEELSALLSVLAAAQIGFARYLQPYLTDGPEGYIHQHAVMLPGNILIRGDTSIMVSPQMYRTHIFPHDSRVLAELGGGGMHCCGDFHHLVPELKDLPSIRCIDFGQPEMNDLDAVYSKVRERQIALIRVGVPNEELRSGAVLDRFPTGVALKQKTGSHSEAREILSAYLEVAEVRRHG